MAVEVEVIKTGIAGWVEVAADGSLEGVVPSFEVVGPFLVPWLSSSTELCVFFNYYFRIESRLTHI